MKIVRQTKCQVSIILDRQISDLAVHEHCMGETFGQGGKEMDGKYMGKLSTVYG